MSTTTREWSYGAIWQLNVLFALLAVPGGSRRHSARRIVLIEGSALRLGSESNRRSRPRSTPTTACTETTLSHRRALGALGTADVSSACFPWLGGVALSAWLVTARQGLREPTGAKGRSPRLEIKDGLLLPAH